MEQILKCSQMGIIVMQDDMVWTFDQDRCRETSTGQRQMSTTDT